MMAYDLHDVWRINHPTEHCYTWRCPNGRQASRLDMFWLSAFFLTMVLRVDILPFFRSDHSYVYLELLLPSAISRGRGLWKLNCSHLTDQSFIDLVTDFWTFWQSTKSSFLSITAWWDAGKARLRNKIRAFSRTNASTFRKRVSSLENSLFHLNRRLINGEDVNHLVNTTKAELEEAHRQQSRGARIRSNIQWAEEGEASTAYSFRLANSVSLRLSRIWVVLWFATSGKLPVRGLAFMVNYSPLKLFTLPNKIIFSKPLPRNFLTVNSNFVKVHSLRTNVRRHEMVWPLANLLG
jgi:hypothetical protein